MRRKSLYLLVSSTLTLLMLSVTWITIRQHSQPPLWIVPIAIPFALLFPGYAIIAVIHPKLESATSILYSLGLSICLLVCSGFILNATPWGMQPGSWAIWLSTIILSLNTVAWFRRPAIFEEPPSFLPKLKPGEIFGLVLTIVILIGTVVVSAYSISLRDKPYTQFWAIPTQMPNGSYALKIGTANQTTSVQRYNIYAESSGRKLQEWKSITLEPNDEWTTTLQLQNMPSKPIHIFLYLQEKPDAIYRMVQISPEAFSEIPTSLP